VRVAVAGAGAFGKNHLRVYRELETAGLDVAGVGVALVAAVEPDQARAADTATKYAIPVFATVDEMLRADLKLDAATVSVPTVHHHAVASTLLDAGLDLLVEKPLAATLAEADDLIARAGKTKRILQPGHLERFNPAVLAVQPQLRRPMFFEAHRLSVFTPRSLDVDVVLDLMIHDIDLILSIVRSPVVAVDAIGSSVFSKEIDIANARLRFANGCVANATASRVSLKTERKLRLFQDDAYMSLDLQQKILTVIRKGAGVGADGMPQVTIDENTYEQGDALKSEIEAFLQAVVSGAPPPVTGEDGLLALRTAVSIAEQVASSMQKFS
jgi:predicted dehydrogenase